MALVNCKECGKEVSSGAKKCPNCGKDQRNWFMRHKILSFIGVLIALGIIGSALGGNKEPGKTSNTPASSTNVQQKADEKKEVISKENYDKIKNGMTKDEVKAILGEASSVSENEIQGVGKTEMFHYQKGFSTTAIDVFFTNGKVSSKNWTQL